MNAVVPYDRWAQPQPDAERQPPHNVEAEQALLGAVLVNNDAFGRVSGFLKPEHFAEEIHRRIWEVAAARIAAGQRADPITLKTFLGDHDLGDGITVPGYLARLARDAVTIVNAPDYARMVADLAARRDVIASLGEVVEQAYDGPVTLSVAALLEQAETALMDLRVRAALDDKGTRITAGDAAADLLAEVDRVMAGESKPAGVTTGIPDLDFDTGGMTPGDLWVIGGRASMGKTIAATSLARAAARSGAGTLLFPFEIGARKATARILADLSYRRSKPLGYGQILKGQVDADDRWCLEDAWKRLQTMPLVIDGSSRGTLASINARIRSERERMRKHGVELKVVVLDYLKYIKASDRYKGQRVYEIGEITVGLKEIAKDQNVCIVLLAQVNRQTEGRDDKRPGLGDLRESGDIETDADVILFVYREHYYYTRSPEYRKGGDEALLRARDLETVFEMIVGKNRDGATRSHVLWCDVACSKISARDLGGI